MRRSRKGCDIFWRGTRKRDVMAVILLKTLLGEKDVFFGKRALLHFEEMFQKGVSELHPQCLRRRGMLAQVQWG